jgi:hypothetical protein
MNPQSLASASQGLSAGGTGVSLFGNLLQGMSSSNMYRYQGGIARLKEQFALQNADYAVNAGDKEAHRYGLKSSHQFGKIVAAQAASGIDVGRGSTVDVQRSQRHVTGLDSTQIVENAARKAYGYKVEAAVEGAKAEAYDMASRNAMLSSGINMASTLMTGATSVHSRWLQANQLGIYSGSGIPWAPDDL